jgi:signal transduction histidine kinase
LKFRSKTKAAALKKKYVKRFFEKFFRTDSHDIHTTESYLGLSLAIARGVIESQNGRIWIENGRDGFVTQFAFQIPIGDDEK